MNKLCVFLAGLAAAGTVATAGAAAVTPAEPPAELKPAVTEYESGLRLLEQNQREEAFVKFTAAAEAARRLSTADAKKLRAAAENNAGSLLLLKGQPDQAEALFRDAVAADPTHALAFNNLGAALLRQGRIADAQAAFEQAVRADPKSPLAYNNLAELLIEAGQLKTAAKYLIASLKQEPRNGQALLLLARVYDASGMAKERDEAVRALALVDGKEPAARATVIGTCLKYGLSDAAAALVREWQAKEPASRDARLAEARLKLVQGRKDEAATSLEALLKENRADDEVRCDLAVAWLAAGKPDDALRVADEGVAQSPSVAELWFVRGRALEKKGELPAAEKSYARAIELRPGLAKAQTDLGILLAKRNEEKGALEHFARAVAADPYDRDAQYNLGRALVIAKADHARGIRLLAAVGATRTEAGRRAREFLGELERVAASPAGGRSK